MALKPTCKHCGSKKMYIFNKEKGEAFFGKCPICGREVTHHHGTRKQVRDEWERGDAICE